MRSGRLEAFTDGVMAILITIMVLELKEPSGANWSDLHSRLPVFLSYLLSFMYLGIYWNNHHHMLQATERVTGAVLWANMALLFWLSLVPFVTAWAGANNLAPAPTALYGIILLLAALSFTILQATIIKAEGPNSILKKAIGRDRKEWLSIALYVTAIVVSGWVPWMSYAFYIIVALIWLVPDRRIERYLD